MYSFIILHCVFDEAYLIRFLGAVHCSARVLHSDYSASNIVSRDY